MRVSTETISKREEKTPTSTREKKNPLLFYALSICF
jgi:hypothetical protein